MHLSATLHSICFSAKVSCGLFLLCVMLKHGWPNLQIFVCFRVCACMSTVHDCGYVVGMCVGGRGGVDV